MYLFSWTDLILINGPWFWKVDLRWPVALRDSCPCPGTRSWDSSVYFLFPTLYFLFPTCALPVPLQFLIPMWTPLALIHPYIGQFTPKEHWAISAYPCSLRCGDQLWEREKGPSPWRMGTELGGVTTFLHTKERLNQKNVLYQRRAKEKSWKFFKKSLKHLLLMSKLCYKKARMRTGR